jgi:chromosome segregation ATPase
VIGVWGSKKMAEMQQRTADLEQQVQALSARLAGMADRFSADRDQLETRIDRLEDRVTELADAERRAEALAGVVSDQAAAIGRLDQRLDEREEQRKELDGRVRADMIRIERQAAIDMTELRQTDLALAERLLMSRK